MTRLTIQLIDEIDGYLRARVGMEALDRELIIRLRDHIVGQDRMVEHQQEQIKNLYDDRRMQLFERFER